MAELLVNIDVDDLEKAVAFYAAAFGLTVGRRFGAFGVELLGASSAIYLLLKEPGTRASPATDQRRDYGRHWTPVHLDVVVADVEAAVARAEQAGGAREGEIQTHGWGRIAHMADPFGHGFCLIQFLGRGYDEIASTPDPRSDPIAVLEPRRARRGNTDFRSHPSRTQGGETVRSAACVDRDDPEAPPPEAGVAARFEALAAPVLGADRTARLRAAVGRIGDRAGGVDDVLELLPCPGEAPP